MEKVLHRAQMRGHREYGWLSTHYSFSFSDWYEPSRLGFGALRVLNDDTIAPASGFPMHSHRDMEIITIVTSGTLTHKDSLDNTGVVHAGDVQVMSAGTGIVHSEYNASLTEPLTLFQIWIQTNKEGSVPRYDQKSFPHLKEGAVMLVGPIRGESPLGIQQDAFISRVVVSPDRTYEYRLQRKGNGVYVFIIEGSTEVAGELLATRDALGISNTDTVSAVTKSSAEILFIEIPMDVL